jgi:glycosyltransferase involved in cell wall biosynthesis
MVKTGESMNRSVNSLIKITVLVFHFMCMQLCSNVDCNNTNGSVNDRRFVIVTASYNNKDWAVANLGSIFSQDYKNFRVIYYDDCSTDRTADIVQQFVKDKKVEHKLRLVRNPERVGAHLNIYRAVHSCDDDEIIVLVDGDDWLAHDHVLSQLNEVYSLNDTWITYGQFKIYPSENLGACRALPQDRIKKNSIRSFPWLVTHLKTFYAWLYKRIKIEDLFFDGKFIRRVGDLAVMYPMLEMAGFHSKFIPDVLYIYNRANELNFFKKGGDAYVSDDERDRNLKLIKVRPRYLPLQLPKEKVRDLCGK